jgi:ATP/maltotriose-dependent transcriptional regulator MalT
MFQQVVEEIGAALPSALQSPRLHAMEKTLSSLLNEVAVKTDPLSVALDDYHLLAETAIVEVMEFLIHQQTDSYGAGRVPVRNWGFRAFNLPFSEPDGP